MLSDCLACRLDIEQSSQRLRSIGKRRLTVIKVPFLDGKFLNSDVGSFNTARIVLPTLVFDVVGSMTSRAESIFAP